MGRASRRKKEQKHRPSGKAHHAPAPSGGRPPRQTALAPREVSASPSPAAPARPAKQSITATASAAYQEWLREAIATQRSQMDLPETFGPQEDGHVLAPLVRRMGQTPGGRNVIVDLSPVFDPQARRYMLGLAVSAEDPSSKPDAYGMPQFNPGFALPLPYEPRNVRAGDAVTWLVYRAISDGKLDPDKGEAVAAYAGRAAALATPREIRLAPGYLALPANALFDYEGFGDSAAEDPVSPDLTAAQRHSGPAALPVGNWLIDDPADTDGRRLAYGIEEVRDCTAGLWVVEEFYLPRLIELLPRVVEERGRIVTLTHELARAVDQYLADERQGEERSLRETLATPAEIAEETAPYDELREQIRAVKTVQESLIVLARALFELQPPAPEPGEDEGEDEALEGEVLTSS